MNKYKIITKKGNTFIEIKSQKEQHLCEREFQTMNDNSLKGLLAAEVIQKRAKFILHYPVTGLTPFCEYIRNPISKDKFLRMLKEIIALQHDLQENYISQQYIVMDVDYVFVNPQSGQLQFICVPIQLFDAETPIKEFLLNIIQFASFNVSENTEYVSEFISILNKGINFSIFELEEFVKRQTVVKTGRTIADKKCPQCHAMVKADSRYCTVCGALLMHTTMMDDKKIFNPLTQNVKPLDSENIIEISKPESIPESEEIKTKYLIRKSTSEKIMLSKSPFRIGKTAEKNDYAVANNATVSRVHAEFIVKGNRCYIIDLKSTNRTFVNGTAITPEREVEIVNGTVILLANEEFVLRIE